MWARRGRRQAASPGGSSPSSTYYRCLSCYLEQLWRSHILKLHYIIHKEEYHMDIEERAMSLPTEKARLETPACQVMGSVSKWLGALLLLLVGLEGVASAET